MPAKKKIFGKHSTKASLRPRNLERDVLCGFEVLESRMLMAGLPTVIDIVAGAGGSNPSNFTNVNNTVFFFIVAVVIVIDASNKKENNIILLLVSTIFLSFII